MPYAALKLSLTISAERRSICKSRLRTSARSMHSRNESGRFGGGKFVVPAVAVSAPLRSRDAKSRTCIFAHNELAEFAGQSPAFNPTLSYTQMAQRLRRKTADQC